MSNAILAVQVYTVTKESIPVCNKTTCMASYKLATPSFSGVVQEGLKLVLPVKIMWIVSLQDTIEEFSKS